MGAYSGGYTRGAIKIIVDIKKKLVKDLVYFSRNFFISIYSIIIKSMKFYGNSIKREGI